MTPNNTTDEWLWTDWHGGECPLGPVAVYVRARDGWYDEYENAQQLQGWQHNNVPSDFVAYAIRNPNYVAPQPVDLAALLKMAVEALGDIVTRSYDDGLSKVIDMRDIAQTTLDAIRKAGVM